MVKKSAIVEMVKTEAGMGAPSHVTMLVAAPKNIRYTHARENANPHMRAFRSLRHAIDRAFRRNVRRENRPESSTVPYPSMS